MKTRSGNWYISENCNKYAFDYYNTKCRMSDYYVFKFDELIEKYNNEYIKCKWKTS